ncbi:unnamed protein product [Cuscuta campestris]|uniref:RPN1 N-terminal domain-containing protein n=1 Tax=Cuscuta campestris TaxID=132261 RepID=A0A484M5G6_9ASTE|nr:unnamed protein product [Cuscuta campestris]
MPSSRNSAVGSGDAGGKTAREESSIRVPAMDAMKDDDLSEEDLALKQQLELYVKRAQDPDPSLQAVALQGMSQEIQTAISSMTSVPKPIKFLRHHYGTLKSHYENMPNSDAKKLMADILSVLALTMSTEGERESLKYRLLGSDGDASAVLLLFLAIISNNSQLHVGLF